MHIPAIISRPSFLKWLVPCWMMLLGPSALESQVFRGLAVGEVRDLPMTAEERRPFIGRYTVTPPDSNQPPITITFYEVADSLFGRGAGDRTRMLYQGSNTFRPQAETLSVIRFTVEGGRATRFTMITDDDLLEGVRMEDEDP
jgi:hypothetical protein